MTDYNPIYLEIVATESVDGDTLDPNRDVPFSVLWETQGTIAGLINTNGGAHD